MVRNSLRTIPPAVGIAALVVMVIILGAIWQRYAVRRNAPEKALQQIASAQTYGVKAELLFNLPIRVGGRERPFPNLQARLDGHIARAENGAPEFTGKLFMGGEGRGEEFTAEGDVRILHDATAFRLDALPVLINPSGSLLKKWTYVPSQLLGVKNGDELRTAIAQVLTSLPYEGKGTLAGETVLKYAGELTPEQKEHLRAVSTQNASGSPAVNVLARLLAAHDGAKVSFKVGSDNALREVQIIFVKQLRDGKAVDRAALRFTFSDIGEPVTVDRPAQQVTVKPDVFRKLFGTGEVTPQ